MPSSSWARSLAERHLASSLPRRWRHVQAVAEQAATIAAALGADADLLLSAAWLHDIGYAPSVVETGFHPLDGARLIRQLDAGDRLASLVGYHSGAEVEAGLRGVADDLHSEFVRERSPVADALWCADLTTGPDGQQMTVGDRLDEIERRYGADHLVSEAVRLSRRDLVGAVERTFALTGAQPR